MKIFNKITNFLKEVRVELTKVSWSTRQELIGSTAVVITVTFIVAAFIGIIDILLSQTLRVVFK